MEILTLWTGQVAYFLTVEMEFKMWKLKLKVTSEEDRKSVSS